MGDPVACEVVAVLPVGGGTQPGPGSGEPHSSVLLENIRTVVELGKVSPASSAWGRV